MQSFTQDSTLLLGSRSCIEELENKETAKVLIVSDSHRNYYAFEQTIIQNPDCDALLFCGDGITEITRLAENALQDKELLKIIPSVIAFVQGNNDYDMYPIVNVKANGTNDEPYFSQIKVPANQCIKICGHSIFMTHGHHYSLYNGTGSIEETARLADNRIAVFGHTHFPLQRKVYPDLTIINPGSITLPRGGSSASYVVAEIKKGRNDIDSTFYSLSGNKSTPFIPAMY